MAISHDDGSVDIVVIGRGRLLGRFVSREHAGEENDWGASGGRLLTHRDNVATLWDVRTSRAIAKLETPAKLNGTGSRVVGMRGKFAVVLDATSGVELARVAVETPVYALAIDDDAKRLVTTGEGKPVHVWNIADGRRVAELEMDHCCPSLTPDGSRVLEYDELKMARLYPLDGGAPEQLASKPFTIAFDPHMRRVAWIDSGDRERVVVLDLATRTRTELPGGGMSLGFDGSGDLLVVDRFGSFDIWTLSENRKLITIETATNRTLGDVGVAISPDGKLVATAGGVWSTADGRQLATFLTPARMPHASEGPNGEPTEGIDLGAESFSADGETALNFMPHGDVTLWDTSVETRSPAEIAAIVDQRVRWQVHDGQLVAKQR
jgi:WD40 repeat protein